MSKKKAGELIPKIISADTKEKAIEVLNDTLEALYLTTDYTELVHLKDVLNGYEKQYKEISDRYRSLDSPRRFENVHGIRVDLNFLYRDIVDELDFSINKNKIYYEERKTIVRSSSILELREDSEFQERIKATSTSALRDVMGESGSYKKYVSLASISYGLYQNLRDLLNSIRLMTDSLASESSYLKNIERRE
jgi:hypothetical protein